MNYIELVIIMPLYGAYLLEVCCVEKSRLSFDEFRRISDSWSLYNKSMWDTCGKPVEKPFIYASESQSYIYGSLKPKRKWGVEKSPPHVKKRRAGLSTLPVDNFCARLSYQHVKFELLSAKNRAYRFRG